MNTNVCATHVFIFDFCNLPFALLFPLFLPSAFCLLPSPLTTADRQRYTITHGHLHRRINP